MSITRDKEGNVREGCKWAIEFNDILLKYFGCGCGYSRGFQKVTIDEHGYLGSVFELNEDKVPSPEFLQFIEDYSSKYIKKIMYRKEVKLYGRVFYRNAIIAIL